MYNNDSLPTKISKQKFNDYIKQVCELAEINEPINDKLIELKKTIIIDDKELKLYRKVKGIRPKYKYVSSHIGRKSFCMMYDGNKNISREFIMRVTGHKNLSSYLTYINKTDESHLQEFEKMYENR